jgi:hypothetical protein
VPVYPTMTAAKGCGGGRDVEVEGKAAVGERVS